MAKRASIFQYELNSVFYLPVMLYISIKVKVALIISSFVHITTFRYKHISITDALFIQYRSQVTQGAVEGALWRVTNGIDLTIIKLMEIICYIIILK